MQVLQVIGYILLFILFLSLLIVVHEAGHLSAAKAFKVYCEEFSVGFGPKIFSKKRKNGETKFSLRAIPFGGYVSMYGESEEELPEGVVIPKERSLNGIKKWKRAIILVAGVTMNAILAIVLFYVSNQCFVQQSLYSNYFEITQRYEGEAVDSPFYRAFDEKGLIKQKEKEDDPIPGYIINPNVDKQVVSSADQPPAVIAWTTDGIVSFEDGSNKQVAVCIYTGFNITDFSMKTRTLSDKYVFYTYTIQEKDGTQYIVLDKNPIEINNSIKDVTFTVNYQKAKEEIIPIEVSLGKPSIKVTADKTIIEYNSGLAFYLYEHWNNFGEAVQATFENFGKSSIAIFQGFGALFTQPQNASGIIGIGFITSQTLQNMGWGKFLYLWGFISVNLAIVNLFPFPGLDGWQLLVLAVEGIFHKEIPTKVKSIISVIGIALLFMLMIALVFKDAFTFIF